MERGYFFSNRQISLYHVSLLPESIVIIRFIFNGSKG